MKTATNKRTLTGLAATSLRWRRRAAHGLLDALARAGNWAIDLSGAIANVDVIRDVPYGEHPVAHLLDIYRPRFAPRPLPVLLYIHGGAFVICSKETHRHVALLNAERAGYLVFCINYRLAPNHPFPAAIEDACDAYRWVVENAARYGGDPQRIVVAGESAGGNLALGVTIAATYDRPEPYARRILALNVAPVGVMPLMPYLQASDPESRANDPGVGYVTLSVARSIAEAYLEDSCTSERNLMADPIRVLESCGAPVRPLPPVFTGVGTADLCCTDVRRLEVACRNLQVPVQALYYEGEIHAFHTLHWRSAARTFWRESVAFMRQRARQPLPATVRARTLDAVLCDLRLIWRRLRARVAEFARSAVQMPARGQQTLAMTAAPMARSRNASRIGWR